MLQKKSFTHSSARFAGDSSVTSIPKWRQSRDFPADGIKFWSRYGSFLEILLIRIGCGGFRSKFPGSLVGRGRLVCRWNGHRSVIIVRHRGGRIERFDV